MTKWVFSLIGLLVVLVLAFHLAGIRYNVSESYPSGLYRVDKGRFPKVGELTLFCLPENQYTELAKERFYLKEGFCSSGTLPMTKRLVGIPGDVILKTKTGISVNGQLEIENTKSLTTDSFGRSLPLYLGGELSQGMYFLISEHSPKSWDSRYFGPVNGNHIIGAITPFLIWGK